MSRKIWYITFFIAAAIILSGIASNFSINAKGHVEKCNLVNKTDYDGCVNKVAEQKGPNVCKYVDGAELIEDCYIHAAMGKNSPYTCKKTSNQRKLYECYGKLAIYNQRSKILEKIDTKAIREKWYMTYALKFNESMTCRIITDINKHGECYLKLAKNTKNSDFCFYIDQGSVHKDECLIQLASILDNEELCNSITSIRKSKCITEVGG